MSRAAMLAVFLGLYPLGNGVPESAGAPRGGPAAPCSATIPALITVQTAGPEQFIVRVTDTALLAQMIDICLGNSPQMIVIGDLLAGGAGYNRDPLNGVEWSWHMDESTVGLAEFTIELCDGIPSFVEADLAYWLGNVGTFCPWSSQIVAIDADAAILGDMNCDTTLDGGDIAPFVEALVAPAQYIADHPDCNVHLADMNLDGSKDMVDVDLFIAVLLS